MNIHLIILTEQTDISQTYKTLSLKINKLHSCSEIKQDYRNITETLQKEWWGIRCAKLYLAGKRFTLQTDHKPLKYLKDAAYQNDRVFRWAMTVQEYSFHVCRRLPGKENIGADFWSRIGYSS